MFSGSRLSGLGGAAPVIGRSAAIGPREEALWQELAAAFKSTLETLRGLSSATSAADTSKSTALRKVHTRMEWYSKTYEVVQQSVAAAEFLYKHLRTFVDEDLKMNVKAKLLAECKNENALFLSVAAHYKIFGVFRLFCKTVLGHLENFYIQRSNRPSIEILLNTTFYNVVYLGVKDTMASVLIQRTNRHRDGEIDVDMDAIRSGIRIFAEISSVADAPGDVNLVTPVSAAATDGKQPQQRHNRLQEDFLKPYVAAIKMYYTKASAQHLSSSSGFESYVTWVASKMRLEDGLVRDLLSAECWGDVWRQLYESLILPHAKTLVQHPRAGLRCLMTEQQWQQVESMYELLCKTPEGSGAPPTTTHSKAVKNVADVVQVAPGVDAMAKEMTIAVTEEVTSCIREYTATMTSDGASSIAPEALREAEVTLVNRLSELWKKYAVCIASHLKNDSVLSEAMREGFRVAFASSAWETGSDKKTTKSSASTSSSPSECAGEIFAKYADLLCRRELKDLSDGDAESQRAEHLTGFLVLLQERDIFQESYRTKLAKRLLQTTPVMDVERLVLDKLQRALGRTFTHKYEAMIRDSETAAELQRAFDAERTATASDDTPNAEQFAVQVLTASHWPSYRCDHMTAPASLEAGMRAFRFFYAKRHASRTLQWLHMLGTSQLQISFPKGTKDIAATVFQASVLLTIAATEASQQRRGCTVAAVASQLSLPLPLVKAQIASMYLHKVFNILSLCNANGELCPPAGTINESDFLTLNISYVHKLRKFKLAAPVAGGARGAKGAADGGAPLQAEMDVIRRAQADAAIVRLMKSRRSLSHADLVDQAIQQLSRLFSPTPSFLKQRIEDLIQRGYLRREESNHAMYEYIA